MTRLATITPVKIFLTSSQTPYGDQELKEFKKIILKKIDLAEEDLFIMRQDYQKGASTPAGNMIIQLLVRQEKFIRKLKNALIRIENKEYGVCRVTGKPIQKERLKLVPYATLSIEAKRRQ